MQENFIGVRKLETFFELLEIFKTLHDFSGILDQFLKINKNSCNHSKQALIYGGGGGDGEFPHSKKIFN